MKKYFLYLKYIIRHKWFVMIECFLLGFFWRGITHDLSKLLPSEFFPYANWFYGKYGIKADSKKLSNKDKVRICKEKYQIAWLKHQHRNPHHWQHWILQNDTEGMMCLEMPVKYVVEMICDWIGAGKAITDKNNLEDWFSKSSTTMILNKKTKALVLKILAAQGYNIAEES